MKNISKVLFIVFCIVWSPHSSIKLYSQSAEGFYKTFKEGKYTDLDIYFEDMVEFCLYDDQQLIPKNEAINRLASFRQKNNILSVELIHKGVSKNKTSTYKVLKVTTSKGVYRVFVYSKGDIGAKTVQEIRIDKF